MPPHRAWFHRLILALACSYNLGFGLWAGFWPRAFFEVFEMEPPRYPGIWSCLGMVVGIYGLAYGYAAFRLDRARPFVALGLLGKVLGPIGWCLAVRSGEFPLRSFTLILFNDVIWWLPFALILLEETKAADRLRALAPFACAVLNALAGLGMLVLLRPGTEAVADPAERARYILEHPAAWRGGWAIWIAAASSLLAFYAWWACRLGNPRAGRIAFAIALVGFLADMLAESLFIGWLSDRLEAIASLGTFLTGAVANGLYTVAGTILTLATRPLPRWLIIWCWAVWISGYGLTAAALAGSVPGIVASTATLMILFPPWAWVMGRRLR